ncbi:TPA: hypothetical protein N0F65_002131 [Lagenidium giganteum]|uniref:Uncharacterized protein n=1 Tax=Lagenidium giganteum TaxID=4803 RepID=A0AAV2ZHM8_9STRA|nr:TPA: hypothetical protein N0F65_002131 [Lagenidium giganteum]
MPSGSNKAQWNAMDLHIGTAATMRYKATGAAAASTTATRKPTTEEDLQAKGLSARNILIRRKLMERKRFDSADYAMKKSKCSTDTALPGDGDSAVEGATAMAQTQSMPAGHRTTVTKTPTLTLKPQQTVLSPAHQASRTAPFSPAQVGVSVFFNALEHDEPAATKSPRAASTPTVTTSPRTNNNAGAGRYGPIGRQQGATGPTGALSARNILLQKKLREKKMFDSADYQLAKQQHRTDDTSSSAMDMDSAEQSTATPMDVEASAPQTQQTPAPTQINSPMAAAASHHERSFAQQMSPSTRVNKYEGLSGSNVLLMRKLAEKKRFDSADYQMHAPRAQSNNAEPSKPVSTPTNNTEPVTEPSMSPPPAPFGHSSPTPAPTNSPASSKYGKLCAANVLIRKKLKERKRFDSADYSMECFAKTHTPNSATEAQQDARHDSSMNDAATLMAQPNKTASATVAEDVDMSTPDSDESSPVGHQVKHLKLAVPGASGGWTKYGTVMAQGGSLPRSLAMNSATAASQDSRLAARSIMIQRKLTERKRFDSADYFKEAAAGRE